MARKLILTAAIFIFLSLSACIDENCVEYYELPGKNLEIGFIGDSIIVIGTETCTSVSSYLSYELNEQVSNYAKNGYRINGIIWRYEALTKDIPSITTVISNGSINDSRYCDPDTVIDATIGMFNTIAADGRDLIFLVQYEAVGLVGSMLNDAINYVGDALMDACAAIDHVVCVDLRPVFANKPSYIIADEIHPSHLGRRAMVPAIQEVL